MCIKDIISSPQQLSRLCACSNSLIIVTKFFAKSVLMYLGEEDISLKGLSRFSMLQFNNILEFTRNMYLAVSEGATSDSLSVNSFRTNAESIIEPASEIYGPIA